MKKVKVVAHDPTWRNTFEAESKSVGAALGENVVAIHHIGSTAIPNIYAKPVIDILVEVRNINEVEKRTSAMESIGYEAMGEYGIPNRRYFRKNNQKGIRTHQIHIFEIGSAQIARHLSFRDYMIAHTEEAQKYSELKRKLADEHPLNMEAYIDGKDDFIKEIDRRASQWRPSQTSSSQQPDIPCSESKN